MHNNSTNDEIINVFRLLDLDTEEKRIKARFGEPALYEVAEIQTGTSTIEKKEDDNASVE